MKKLRKDIHEILVSTCHFADLNSQRMSNNYANVISLLQQRFKDTPCYGLANEEDFGEKAKIIATLCAYTDKQYYLYKAVSDRNKIGYLSRKQYRRYMKTPENEKKVYLASFGRMATLYKLMERAITENKFARFLKVFKESFVESDKAKDFFEAFAKMLHSSSSGMQIVPCTIKEAYDMPLRDINHRRGHGTGSGARFAITSCMEGTDCEPYYKLFGAEAYKVVVNEGAIGRFLVWKTAKGKTYIDRLYCNGMDAGDALALIEKKFGYDNVVYYPNVIEPDDYVPCKDVMQLTEKVNRPYLDSFFHFKYDEKEKLLFLQHSNGAKPSTFICKARYAPYDISFCECGALLAKGYESVHDFICPILNGKSRYYKHFVRIHKEFQEEKYEPLY